MATDIDIIPLDILENNRLWRIVNNASQLTYAINDLYYHETKEKIDTEDLFEFDMKLLDKIFFDPVNKARG